MVFKYSIVGLAVGAALIAMPVLADDSTDVNIERIKVTGRNFNDYKLVPHLALCVVILT